MHNMCFFLFIFWLFLLSFPYLAYLFFVKSIHYLLYYYLFNGWCHRLSIHDFFFLFRFIHTRQTPNMQIDLFRYNINIPHIFDRNFFFFFGWTTICNVVDWFVIVVIKFVYLNSISCYESIIYCREAHKLSALTVCMCVCVYFWLAFYSD